MHAHKVRNNCITACCLPGTRILLYMPSVNTTPSQRTSTQCSARWPPVGVAQLRKSDSLTALDKTAAGIDGAVQTRIAPVDAAAAQAAETAAADHMAAANSAVLELVVAPQTLAQPHPPSSGH